MIGLIRAHDVDRWGSRIVSPPEFPRLVRRLVFATGRSLRTVDFPSDEATRLAGWDGKVLADEETPNVPIGFSVWELGTGNDPREKADYDYNKRTENALGIDQSQTTFVFVTPRNWGSKRTWADNKRDERKWKDVRVIDAEDLAQWIESAPGVAAWFGPIIGTVPTDARSVEAECDTYKMATHPPFDLGGVLIGRDAQHERLVAFLKAPPATMEISATTTAEGTAFVGGCLQLLPEDERESILSRAVWVDSNAGLRHLAAADRPLFVLASDDLAALPVRHHRIVVKTNRVSGPNSMELGAQQVTALVEYLTKLGLDHNDAYERCQDAGGYLERVRHTLLVIQGPRPNWAQSAASVAVAASVLMGEWDERNVSDRAVVTAIAGVDYEEFVRAITPYQTGPSPLVSRAGGIWKVYARPAAWRHLEPSLTARQLEAFLHATREVLLEDDPRFELAPEERWMADAHNKGRAHSEHLRRGLAAGLVHAAVIGRDDSACYAGWRAQSRIDASCRELFRRRGDADFWRRIRGELRQLAEASPDQFLSALQADLAQPPHQVRDLFEEEGIHGGCLQSKLLWALELLAWSPEYAGRAALALAALDEIDPGGRYSNRPGNSLIGTLQPANPQCSLTSIERRALFESIVRRHPQAGWRLGKALMPSGTMVMTPGARPELREWAPKQQTTVLISDYWNQIEGVVEILLQSAGSDVERWSYLLKNLKPMQAEQMERVLHGAEVLARTLQGEERMELWRRLRALLHHHNQFTEGQSVDWTYAPELLDRLASIYRSLEPTNLIDQFGWLFSYQANRPFQVMLDFKEEQARIDRDRAAAIPKLMSLGLDELIASLSRFEAPNILGLYLGRSTFAGEIERTLMPRCANSVNVQEQEFVQGFSVARYEEASKEFLSRWCIKESPDFLSQFGAARILQAIRASNEIWDIVEAAGPECHQLYWEKVSIYLFDRPSEAERAARNLLVANRARDATNLLAANISSAWLSVDGDLQLIVESLKAFVSQRNADTGEIPNEPYNVARLFKALVESKRLASSELLELEWMYFRLLEHHAEHELEIYKQLLFKPELLLQFVAMIYLPEGTSKSDRSPPAAREQALADQAWKVLYHWQPFAQVPPAAMPSSKELTAAVEMLRALAAERHFRGIVDDLIGKALATSPAGIDGCWPHESVRDVLERHLATEEIADAFVIGKRNLRGTTSRHPGDGGSQERDLAHTFGNWQRATAVTHPCTSKLLGQLAEGYRSDANWEDVEVRAQ